MDEQPVGHGLLTVTRWWPIKPGTPHATVKGLLLGLVIANIAALVCHALGLI